LVGQSLEELGEILACELPLERFGCLLVESLEGEEPLLEFVEVGDIAGVEDLALEDGEIDLDLIEPARMDGQMDKVGVGPVLGEAVYGEGPAVTAAVVDDPEHPFGRGVGLDTP